MFCLLNSNLSWKNLITSNTWIIPTASEVTYNTTVNLEDVHEIIILLCSYAYNYYCIRQSLTVINPNVELSAAVVPDFMFAGTRMYFSMQKVTANSIKIHTASPTSGTVYWGESAVRCRILYR